ncbi:MAG TPA: VPDSG-CTERM sorting domain-containing protein [Verrucomicrobiae bacterium]|jgi:hypothetical protein|nr:VPDSG-CTERM sorting domain-containing protein [Verrucomicrobiae bacterium]
MKQILKTSIAAGAALVLAASANAAAFNQGLTISDGNGHTITLSGTTGALTYDSSVSGGLGDWDIVITSGTAKPPLGSGGSAANPFLDLGILAEYVGAGAPGSTLTVTFFGTGYGPTSGHANAQLTGHMVNGAGGAITFNTYYSALNTGATTTGIAASGPLSPSSGGQYSYTGSGNVNAALYSETEVVTLSGIAGRSNAGEYSIDASLSTVPDGGTTLVLLGSALSSLAFLRKRFAKVA